MDIVWIDSRARVSGTPENFCSQLLNGLRGTDVSAVRVDQVRLTNSFRTVENSNRHVYVKVNGVMRYAVLELGFFSATELAAHLSLRTGLNWEYISWSNSLRCSRETGQFHIMTDAELAMESPWTGPAGTTASQLRSFNDVLRNPHGAVVENGTFTTLYLNCSRYDTVYLTCSEFSSRKVHGPTHGRHNILCRIDVNTPLGTVLTAAFPLNCCLCGRLRAKTLALPAHGLDGQTRRAQRRLLAILLDCRVSFCWAIVKWQTQVPPTRQSPWRPRRPTRRSTRQMRPKPRRRLQKNPLSPKSGDAHLGARTRIPGPGRREG